jgi:hypothetical protein
MKKWKIGEKKVGWNSGVVRGETGNWHGKGR